MHEADVDRYLVDIAAYLVAQSCGVFQACGVLLSGDDTSGRGQVGEGLVDTLYVLGQELVMVAEGQGGRRLAAWCQVAGKLLGRADARQ